MIGAASGAAGAAVVASGPVRLVEHGLAVVAACLMLAVGLEMVGLPIGVGAWSATLTQAALRRLLGGVIASSSPAAPLALGVFNAFLPCQLICAFAARAASTASIVHGTLTMLAFGLGTVPAMLAAGTLRGVLSPPLRTRLSLASAVLVLGFEALTLARGLDLLPQAGHVR